MASRSKTYTSDRLTSRKARILKEARTIIGEKGLDNLNMRELAARSGVALATLYNLYGSKDNLIGFAVNNFFEPIVENTIASANSKTPLNRLLLLLEKLAQDVINTPAYARVVVSLYYKPEPGEAIHRMLYDLAFKEFSQLIDAMRNDENFIPWASTPLLADEIAEQIMVRIYQWCREDLRDNELADIMKYSVLQILVGSTKGKLNDGITQHLKKLTRKRTK
jgi:AcrR family transcriptional regulator